MFKRSKDIFWLGNEYKISIFIFGVYVQHWMALFSHPDQAPNTRMLLCNNLFLMFGLN